MSVQKLMHFV